ncbi:dTDP-4-dehydrorhamnose 3,5-epimerase family protein [Parapusillimonas sp. JC17]|uniref:dTDP-4-dehydrorhamnose 3,5-epimerase family protein n=1 Tax=Parapusillimonas sp. JC17 TaxID=3445768 RepID=UPI003FA003C1
MSRFILTPLPVPGLKRVIRTRLGDERGYLTRLYCADELDAAGWHKPIAQINHTHTALKGTVRGMHYQRPPHAETKLVSCLQGRVWDVAIDLRQGSPTFLQWHAEELSADNLHALLIPAGFAHGFQALTDNVTLLYCHDESYTPEAEAGLNPKDPALSIRWPKPITVMSERDAHHPLISEDFAGIKT